MKNDKRVRETHTSFLLKLNTVKFLEKTILFYYKTAFFKVSFSVKQFFDKIYGVYSHPMDIIYSAPAS